MENCIFCKVVKGDFNTQFVYQDEKIVVFPDIHPRAEVHLIVIPKIHIDEVLAVVDGALYSKIFTVIAKIAREKGLEGKGFRVVVNAGGAQEVDHLHFHLIGPIGTAKKP